MSMAGAHRGPQQGRGGLVDETASDVRSVKVPPPGTVRDAEGQAEHAARAPARMGLAAGLARTARPRQWVKNLLVFAAPGAAGVLTRGPVLARSLAAFAIFCVAASGTYFMNDTFDRGADRLHPGKPRRPVAAGRSSRTPPRAGGCPRHAGRAGRGGGGAGLPGQGRPPPA